MTRGFGDVVVSPIELKRRLDSAHASCGKQGRNEKAAKALQWNADRVMYI